MPEKPNNNPDGLTVDYLANWILRLSGYRELNDVNRTYLLGNVGATLLTPEEVSDAA